MSVHASQPTDEIPSYTQSRTGFATNASLPDQPTHLLNACATLPLCNMCGPVIQALLAERRGSLHQFGEFSPEAECASRRILPSEYALVPAFVHRSQLVNVADPAASSGLSLSASLASPVSSTGSASQALAQRKTRRGVKVACTNCRSAGKRCDEARPCQRCVKHNTEGSCVNPPPKPRQRPARKFARDLGGGVSGKAPLAGTGDHAGPSSAVLPPHGTLPVVAPNVEPYSVAEAVAGEAEQTHTPSVLSGGWVDGIVTDNEEAYWTASLPWRWPAHGFYSSEADPLAAETIDGGFPEASFQL